jgi:hypothetical protein
VRCIAHGSLACLTDGGDGGGVTCWCERVFQAGEWTNAWGLFEHLSLVGLEPDRTTYNVLLDALWTGGQVKLAVAFLRQAMVEGHFLQPAMSLASQAAYQEAAEVPPSASSSPSSVAVISAQNEAGEDEVSAAEAGQQEAGDGSGRAAHHLDLHEMTAGTAQASLMLWLARLGRLTAGRAAENCLPGEIRVVTGWGRHSRTVGRSPVRESVASLLQSLNSPFTQSEGNAGLLVARGAAVHAWLHDDVAIVPMLQQLCGEDEGRGEGEGSERATAMHALTAVLDPSLLPISLSSFAKSDEEGIDGGGVGKE